MKRRILLLSVFLCILSGGCKDDPKATKRVSAVAPEVQVSEVNKRRSAIPSDVTYSIITSDTWGTIKRSLDIRLSRKVSKDVLREIAYELKTAGKNEYETTFILYYLPGMKLCNGAWARTNFDPHLEVKILGMTIEAEEKIKSSQQSVVGEIVGTWFDHDPFLGGQTILFLNADRFYVQRKFKDGSTLTEEVVESKSSCGRRFDKKTNAQTSDHWVLDRVGNLQLRDNSGVITTAKPMN